MKQLSFLTLALLFSCFQTMAQTTWLYYDENNTGWYFTEIIGEQYNTACITGTAGYIPDNLVIPIIVSAGDESWVVTEIGDNACTNKENIKTLKIPGTVKAIGNNAFESCTSLQTLNLEEGVQYVGNSAFQRCSELKKVYVPSSLKSFGYSAFNACLSLAEVHVSDLAAWCAIDFNTSINGSNCNPLSRAHYLFMNSSGVTDLIIPQGVTTIKPWTFSDCRSITSVTIPEGMRTIGERAFFNCSNIKVVYLPKSLQSIDDGAFAWCTYMTDIYCSATTAPSISNETFELASDSYDKTSTMTLHVPESAIEQYRSTEPWSRFGTIVAMDEPLSPVIYFADANVKAICVANWDTNGDGELDEDEAEAVTELSSSTFNGNANITSFNEFRYFTGLEIIPLHAFMECVNLASITIPSSVKQIEYDLTPFYSCINLTSLKVDAGNSVYDSRENCNAIIETATDKLVAGCKGTVIPNSVKSIADRAFYKSGFVLNDIPSTITKIGAFAFFGCNVSSIHIPANVVSIGDNPFCDSGISSITVDPENSIYDSRNDCNAIIETATNKLIAGCTQTLIPNGVVCIGNAAFQNCPFDSFIIPRSVTTIEDYAFYCTYGALTQKLTVLNTTPPSLAANSISNRSSTTLYVPFDSKPVYETADYWKDFKEIVELEPELTPEENPLFMDDAEALADSKAVIYLNVKALASMLELMRTVTAFKFEVKLPDGVTVQGQTLGNLTTDHTLACSHMENGNWMFTGNSMSSSTLKGNEGVLMNMILDIDKNLPVGEYVIEVLNIELTTTDGTAIPIPDFTAKLTIKEVGSSVTLMDGQPFENENDVHVNELTYTRDFRNTNWQALYIPFEVNVEDIADDLEVAYINAVHQYDDDGDGEVDRTTLEWFYQRRGTIQANDPTYLIRAKTTGVKTIKASNVTLKAADTSEFTMSNRSTFFTFYGTYEGITGEEVPDFWAYSGGTVKKAASATAKLGSYRWYLLITGRGARKMKLESVFVDAEATGVQDISNAPENNATYDLTGRRVERANKGIYIMNGKKVIKK